MKNRNIIQIFCIVFLFFNSYANSQTNWELILPPGPTSNQLVSLHFINETTGWAVGEYGTILKSTDAGESWRLIEIPQLNYLTDVYFPTLSTGYIVGKDGMILKSADGGESWFPQKIRFTNNLHRVRFRDENNGWVIGEKGLILHTGDGGMNWEQQISNSPNNLNGLALIDDSSACVVGNDSTLLITQDNGKSWQRKYFTSTGWRGELTINLMDVFFLNESRGWIGGNVRIDSRDFGIILKTLNGGALWRENKVTQIEYEEFGSMSGDQIISGIQQIHFLNSDSGVCLVGFNPDLANSIRPWIKNVPLSTVDGGKTWYAKMPGVEESFTQPGRFAVLSKNRILNTGYRGEFRISADQGASWQFLQNQPRNFSDIRPGNNGWILGRFKNVNNTYLYAISNDYGKSREIFTPRFLDKNNALQSGIYFNWLGNFIDNHDILLTKSFFWNGTNRKASTYQSDDLGRTWTLVQDNVAEEYNETTHFVTPDTVFYYQIKMLEITSNNYKPEITFSSSFDGGITRTTNHFIDIWNEIRPYKQFDPPKIISRHYFFNGRNGFLIGSEGNIIKTTNTGRSWENIPSGVADDLWDITFINRQTGFVVGDFGRILKTIDGGQTWRKTDSGTQEDVYSIGFSNESEGWAGTETGLRYTRDGGETWQGVPLRYFHGPVREIEFDKDGTGYAYTHKLYPNEDWNTRPGGYFLLMVLKEGGVAVENEPLATPYQFTLSQNYPNPFNRTTHIRFSLPENESVSLKIYNIQGQLVRTLLDEVRQPGEHAVAWDGTSNSGQLVASGVYFLRLIQGGRVQVRKAVVLN